MNRLKDFIDRSRMYDDDFRGCGHDEEGTYLLYNDNGRKSKHYRHDLQEKKDYID